MPDATANSASKTDHANVSVDAPAGAAAPVHTGPEPKPRQLQGAAQADVLLQQLNDRDLLSRPLHLWLGPLVPGALVSCYLHDVGPALARWQAKVARPTRASAQAAVPTNATAARATAQALHTRAEAAAHAHAFMAGDAAIARERRVAEASAGIRNFRVGDLAGQFVDLAHFCPAWAEGALGVLPDRPPWLSVAEAPVVLALDWMAQTIAVGTAPASLLDADACCLRAAALLRRLLGALYAVGGHVVGVDVLHPANLATAQGAPVWVQGIHTADRASLLTLASLPHASTWLTQMTERAVDVVAGNVGAGENEKQGKAAVAADPSSRHNSHAASGADDAHDPKWPPPPLLGRLHGTSNVAATVLAARQRGLLPRTAPFAYIATDERTPLAPWALASASLQRLLGVTQPAASQAQAAKPKPRSTSYRVRA